MNLQLLNAADGYSVTASGTSENPPASAPISGNSNSFHVTALFLVFRNAVNHVRAGDAFTVIVDARDAQAVPQLAENYDGSVSLASNIPAAGGSDFAIAPGAASASAGTVTFSNLQLLNAVDAYSVGAFGASGATGEAPAANPFSSLTNPFNVTARTLAVRSIANVRAGDAFSVIVDAFDAQATPQLAENYGGSVSLVANVPAGGSGFASAPGAASASAGTVTFLNLQLLNAADGYSVTASGISGDPPAAAPISGNSNSFDVTALFLVFRNAVNHVRAGDAFTVIVDARDAQAIPQLAENYDGSVSLASNSLLPEAPTSRLRPGLPARPPAPSPSRIFNSSTPSTPTASARSARPRHRRGPGGQSFLQPHQPLHRHRPHPGGEINRQRAGGRCVLGHCRCRRRPGHPPACRELRRIGVPGGQRPCRRLRLRVGAGGCQRVRRHRHLLESPTPQRRRRLQRHRVRHLRRSAGLGADLRQQQHLRRHRPLPRVQECGQPRARGGRLHRDRRRTRRPSHSPARRELRRIGIPGGQRPCRRLRLRDCARGCQRVRRHRHLLESPTPQRRRRLQRRPRPAPPAQAPAANPSSSISNPFTVTARTLAVRSIANVRAGDAFSVIVDAVDAQATPQLAENYGGSVSLVANVPAGGSGFASAPGAASASAGTVFFSNLQLLNAADGYSVTASGTSEDPPASAPISGNSNSFDVTAGPGSFSNNNGLADTWTIRKVGGDIEVLSDGIVIDTRPELAFTSITINGEDGQNDTLTVDYTNAFSVPIFFHGGTGADDGLTVQGGTFSSVEYDVTGVGGRRVHLRRTLGVRDLHRSGTGNHHVGAGHRHH